MPTRPTVIHLYWILAPKPARFQRHITPNALDISLWNQTGLNATGFATGSCTELLVRHSIETPSSRGS
ncbi:hypothetical protein Cob_v003714 [Colletotrichum orbiculare MAFF 240422]|uniref:Uncharacterized protein n=1 Tax=Colletotrichum orbiculare (strain 104-T / ATCC 96160 / CBS 514.97 / LARS 414 / MAFF 240422) TaxID=1213857 RepID=A0A484FZA1_COLOR|nr:hypothetical protein Cob_v003714 [Colletotrichum orbiculare MAFF 240422]